MKKTLAAGLAGLSLMFAAGAAFADDKLSVDATPIEQIDTTDEYSVGQKGKTIDWIRVRSIGN